MTSRELTSADDHRLRAEYHSDEAESMNGDWEAVGLFYAAYHYVKAALNADPLFTDMSACEKLGSDISISSHEVTHHQGGKHRGPGVNDLVRKIYPDIYRHYYRLHSASVDVRYKSGLTAVSVQDLRGDLIVIKQKYDSGLCYSPKTP